MNKNTQNQNPVEEKIDYSSFTKTLSDDMKEKFQIFIDSADNKKKDDKIKRFKEMYGPFDIDTYFKVRLNDQEEYFSDKASGFKKQYLKNQRWIIILGAVIPIIVFADTIIDWLPWQKYHIGGILSAIMSAIMSIIAGFDKLDQTQNRWNKTRGTSEMLKKEKFLFNYSAGPYSNAKDEEKVKILIERTEGIISSEVGAFVKNSKNENTLTPDNEEQTKPHEVNKKNFGNPLYFTPDNKEQTKPHEEQIADNKTIKQ
ncbi:MAG: DUF4231 domain-containing protein [Bacteroidales bacterium]|nr:DUF4231 domain-containing protein [Bacteroidales bacterium]